MEMDKKLIARFISESNKIENISINPEDIMAQFRVEKNTGYLGALLFLDSLARDQKIITLEDIFKAHSLIINEQNEKELDRPVPEDQVGAFRTVNVRIGNHIAIDHDDVPITFEKHLSGIQNFLKRVAIGAASKEELVDFAASYHFEFELIHPFIDGNGRTGRALVYYILTFAKSKPFIFENKDKHEEYYPACQSEKKMIEYFKKRF